MARDGSGMPISGTLATTSTSAYGAFKSFTSANGTTTISTTYDANNLLTSVTRTDNGTDVEKYVYNLRRRQQ